MGQSDLPLGSGRAHVKAFERLGWTRAQGRGKGSHMVLTKPGHSFVVCIPDHDQVSRALLAKALKGAGVTIEAYVAAYGKKRG
ncbi:MAG TPA: type II toxin-antitoxin system HicA family toxin [Frankiaceae bacterium]|nr:type II toxin-antitoxin system HicA family toxin [Frankiaceae bacterium]